MKSRLSITAGLLIATAFATLTSRQAGAQDDLIGAAKSQTECHTWMVSVCQLLRLE